VRNKFTLPGSEADQAAASMQLGINKKLKERI
jgi:hypothetical protein